MPFTNTPWHNEHEIHSGHSLNDWKLKNMKMQTFLIQKYIEMDKNLRCYIERGYQHYINKITLLMTYWKHSMFGQISRKYAKKYDIINDTRKFVFCRCRFLLVLVKCHERVVDTFFLFTKHEKWTYNVGFILIVCGPRCFLNFSNLI